MRAILATLALQSKFYLRFVLMLVVPEIVIGRFVSHQFLGFCVAAAVVTMLVALGVRRGNLRPHLAAWVSRWCEEPEHRECRKLLDASHKSGQSHPSDFIEQFETAWGLQKNSRARWIQAVVWLTTRMGIWFLIFMMITSAATDYVFGMSARISDLDKFTLVALMVTTVVVCETHRMATQRGNSDAIRSYIFAASVLLICAASISCEGLLRTFIGHPHISKMRLHFTHELLIAAIATAMMTYDVFLTYREKKRLCSEFWIHLVMLIAMVGAIIVEQKYGLWRKGGQYGFATLVGAQVLFHLYMYLKKVLKRPETGLPLQALAQEVGRL